MLLRKHKENTFIGFIEKKSIYKGTHTVQTHGVRGSTISILICGINFLRINTPQLGGHNQLMDMRAVLGVAIVNRVKGARAACLPRTVQRCVREKPSRGIAQFAAGVLITRAIPSSAVASGHRQPLST